MTVRWIAEFPPCPALAPPVLVSLILTAAVFLPVAEATHTLFLLPSDTLLYLRSYSRTEGFFTLVDGQLAEVERDIPADSGSIVVPENRRNPSSRKIRL